MCRSIGRRSANPAERISSSWMPIIDTIGIHDDEMRSAGFALRRPMDLHIYALGEGTSDKMSDYAWIVDEEQHKRVWGMRYEETEHAGGAEKNRLFDGTVHLDAGNYLVYYHSDDSHSYNDERRV